MKALPKKASRGRTPSGAPNPIDVHVGTRIRMRRNLLGWSQEKLGDLLGLTFQQVQKYEKGLNRVSASRLWDFSMVLNIPVSFFFEDMDKEIANQGPRMFSNKEVVDLNEEVDNFNDDPMRKKETLDLINAYYKIANRQAARHLFDLVVAMSKTQYMCSKDNEE